ARGGPQGPPFLSLWGRPPGLPTRRRRAARAGQAERPTLLAPKLTFVFLQRDDLIRVHLGEQMLVPTRPPDLQGVDLRVRAERAVLTHGACRSEAFAAFHLAIYQQIPRLQGKLRPDRLAIALPPPQLDLEPVISRRLQVVIERVVCVVARIMPAQL